jgi:hypothetical protein
MSYENEFLIQQGWQYPYKENDKYIVKRYKYTDDKGNNIYLVYEFDNELQAIKLYEELSDKENLLKRFKGVR